LGKKLKLWNGNDLFGTENETHRTNKKTDCKVKDLWNRKLVFDVENKSFGTDIKPLRQY